MRMSSTKRGCYDILPDAMHVNDVARADRVRNRRDGTQRAERAARNAIRRHFNTVPLQSRNDGVPTLRMRHGGDTDRITRRLLSLCQPDEC
mgnify:CR=1 FL=1